MADRCHTSVQRCGIPIPGVNPSTNDGCWVIKYQCKLTDYQCWSWQWGSCACLCMGFWNSLCFLLNCAGTPKAHQQNKTCETNSQAHICLAKLVWTAVSVWRETTWQWEKSGDMSECSLLVSSRTRTGIRSSDCCSNALSPQCELSFTEHLKSSAWKLKGAMNWFFWTDLLNHRDQQSGCRCKGRISFQETKPRASWSL